MNSQMNGLTKSKSMQEIKQSDEAWRPCLFGKAGQKFTKDFIRDRFKIMTDLQHPETRMFTRVYGKDYARQITGYLERALKEMK